jgi:uncharacterized membrane protein
MSMIFFGAGCFMIGLAVGMGLGLYGRATR